MSAIIPFLILFFWLLGFFFLWRIPTPRKVGCRDARASELSIIIPARDEEKSLAVLLDSLRRQTLKPLEIIVIDDESGDGTAACAEGEGCLVLRSEDLPEGWAGKPWACWQGAKMARGTILLFLDADTFLEPDGLSNILQEFRERGGLLSIQPFHKMVKPYERLSAFFNIVAMGGMKAFTPLGEKLQPLGAFGPCLACTREEYFALGGHSHEKVRGEILESLTLGKHFLSNSVNVHCLGGKGSISFRMYPSGLASLVEGFSKGFGTGANAMPVGSLLMIVCWITGAFSVTRHLLQAAMLGTAAELWWPALLDGLYVAQIYWMLSRIGNFGFWPALLFQIPLVFFLFVFGLSLLRVFFMKRVPWKGRIVRTPKRS